MESAAFRLMVFTKKKRSESLPQVRRRAGQSLHERWSALVDDQLTGIVFGPLMLWAMCLAIWVETTAPHPLSLRIWVSAAIIATGVAAIKFLRLIPRARALVRGETGERFVAEQLEELRSAGYRCFHDIQRDSYNIDHVLVGPAGVFAIETKFRSTWGGNRISERRRDFHRWARRRERFPETGPWERA